MKKPLGHRSYGSIGHLPSSRMGPGDHHITEGQARICTVKTRDEHDVVIVQEKLDGSNVGIARIGDRIIPLIRAGYMAISSPYLQHHLFHNWCLYHRLLWLDILDDGERLCREWLAQAHGTRYLLPSSDAFFAAFDLIRGHERASYDDFSMSVADRVRVAPLIHRGAPICIDAAMCQLGTYGHYGALDPAEGLVYRVERDGAFDFLAKYVRPEKVDGRYFDQEIWNWKPKEE